MIFNIIPYGFGAGDPWEVSSCSRTTTAASDLPAISGSNPYTLSFVHQRNTEVGIQFTFNITKNTKTTFKITPAPNMTVKCAYTSGTVMMNAASVTASYNAPGTKSISFKPVSGVTEQYVFFYFTSSVMVGDQKYFTATVEVTEYTES